jgi:hypothetical protein
MGTRTNNSYYTAAGQTFQIATGADVAFAKEDVQYLSAALNTHDHSTGFGKQVDYTTLSNKPTTFPAASHAHTGADGTPVLVQASTHNSPDTNASVSSLHHTLGTSSTQAAAGNHTHSTSGVGLSDPLLTGQANIGTGVATLPTVSGNTGKWRYYKSTTSTTTITPATGEALWAPGATAVSAANATYSSPAGESTGWYCTGTNWVCF